MSRPTRIEVEWEEGAEGWVRFPDGHDETYFCEIYISQKVHEDRIAKLVKENKTLRERLSDGPD